MEYYQRVYQFKYLIFTSCDLMAEPSYQSFPIMINFLGDEFAGRMVDNQDFKETQNIIIFRNRGINFLQSRQKVDLFNILPQSWSNCIKLSWYTPVLYKLYKIVMILCHSLVQIV